MGSYLNVEVSNHTKESGFLFFFLLQVTVLCSNQGRAAYASTFSMSADKTRAHTLLNTRRPQRLKLFHQRLVKSHISIITDKDKYKKAINDNLGIIYMILSEFCFSQPNNFFVCGRVD